MNLQPVIGMKVRAADSEKFGYCEEMLHTCENNQGSWQKLKSLKCYPTYYPLIEGKVTFGPDAKKHTYLDQFLDHLTVIIKIQNERKTNCQKTNFS